MSFVDDDGASWLDDEELEISPEAQEIIDEELGDESEPEEAAETVESVEEEFSDSDEWLDTESFDILEFADDPHNAPENQAEESWELVHHFDFIGDAYNYTEGVPVGPLWIVINWEDDTADVYVDRDYDGASV